VDPAMVQPVDVFARRDPKTVDALPGSFGADQLGLEERVERLGEGVVVTVARGPDRATSSASARLSVHRLFEHGQFRFIRYLERFAEIRPTPSIWTVGDCFDNALAETVNGHYKAELIRGPARGALGKPSRRLNLGPHLSPLAQHTAPPRVPGRGASGRVRRRVLCLD
jgi:hypothetical protein